MDEPAIVVADVIQAFMGLDEAHVRVGKQKWNVPPDDGLYVVVDYVDSKPIGVKSDIQAVASPGEGMTEAMSSTVRHVLQIDVMSFSAEARHRKEEIPMALRCMAMEQAMEANNMQFGRIPTSMANAFSLEETAMLSRFTCSLAVTALHVKAPKAVDYYDQFKEPEVTVNG